MRRALTALARLDALARAGQQRLVIVLWYAYVLSGPELARRHKGGAAELVALKFAPQQQVTFWKAHKSRAVRARQMERFGAALLDAAHGAYLGVPLAAAVPTAHDLAAACEALAAAADTVTSRALARVGTRNRRG